MIRISPFVSAMERLLRDGCRYTIHVGEVMEDRPDLPYVLVRLPSASAGSITKLGGGEADAITFLQPITTVAATPDRLLTVVDEVRRALDGQVLQAGGLHHEPLRLEYCSGMLRDDQVTLPQVGHPFYSVDMWRVYASTVGWAD